MKTVNAIINCILAPLALVGLFALGAAIDAAPDQREETANSLSLQDAQRAAVLLSNKEHIAQAQCRQKYGEAIASFDADGQLICQPKRGQASVIQVAKAAP